MHTCKTHVKPVRLPILAGMLPFSKLVPKFNKLQRSYDNPWRYHGGKDDGDRSAGNNIYLPDAGVGAVTRDPTPAVVTRIGPVEVVVPAVVVSPMGAIRCEVQVDQRCPLSIAGPRAC
jgi:hypothetical protein